MAGAARRIGTDERRARLAARHHLASATRARDVVHAAASLVGLHGTDPATVFLAARARIRVAEGTVGSIERALYDERSLVRMLGMRRTMFVVPTDVAPVVHGACTRAIATRERQRQVQLFAGIAAAAGDTAAWIDEVERSTLAALVARGEAFATELATDVPRLRERIIQAEGKSYQAEANITSRVLFLLAAEGRIVRGRPRGSWISSQYRWSSTQAWLGGPMAELPTAEAQVELMRRWLGTFGPATAADAKWWTGWTMGEVRWSFDRLGAVEVDLDGAAGHVLPGDDEPQGSAPAEPWVALLPALDPTVMGWVDRTWYLGAHGPALFDRTGNAGPTVWLDGRIVGGWAQRRDGTIAVQLLEDVGREASAAVTEEADRLGAWIGPVRVTPRFRTPLERDLSA
jgi:hypothetical protein